MLSGLMGMLLSPPAHAELGTEVDPARYIRLAETTSGLVISVRIPPAALKVAIDSDGRRTVSIAGVPSVMVPGQPELPVLVVGVALPEGPPVELSHRARGEESASGPPVRPVPGLDPRDTARREMDPRIYALGTAWPQQPVVIEELHYRELRIARLLIYPVRYDPAAGEVLIAPEMDVRLQFSAPAVAQDAPGLSPAERRVASRLLNGDRLLRRTGFGTRGAGTREAAQAAEPGSGTRGASNPGVKIRVAAEGLVRVTRAALAALGFDPATVDPRNLQLSYRGTPLPCRVTGEADGVFDAADVIEFFGFPNAGRYSRESVFWLEERDVPGLRYPTRAVPPASAPLAPHFQHVERFEQGNSIYTFGDPAQEGDPHFFWVFFEDNPNPPRVTTFTHNAQLPGRDATGTNGLFRVLLSGRTDSPANPDHRVRFFVNGSQIGETTWNGQSFHTAELPFDASLLVAGTNAFRLDYVPITFPDIYYMDWIEIGYPRTTEALSDRLIVQSAPASPAGGGPLRFAITGFSSATDAVALDVTNRLSPTLLTGAVVAGAGPFSITFEEPLSDAQRYLIAGGGGRIAAAGLALDVPSGLRSPGNGADELIIVPPGWEAALAPLVAHRQAQGLRVVLTTLTDVADEFAGGNVDDVALRDAVSFAYHTWQAPALSSLLLVGEPNLDAMNELAVSPYYQFMPTHFGVTEELGETMTDTWFGAVSGSDLVPDVAVGRLSVRSSAQATDIVSKIINYENNLPGGAAWGRNVLHVASNEATFEQSLAAAAQFLPPGFTVDTEYRRLGANASSIRTAFNSGALVASFLGHGNVNFWADSPGGPFFANGDVNAMANAGRIPLVTALNCVNGLVGHPLTVDSMSEAFHNRPAAGALAAWSSSALGFLSEYDLLQSKLYQGLFEEHLSHLGEATAFALLEAYLTGPVTIDLVKEMVLLGDPGGWLAIDGDADQLLDHLEVANGLAADDRDSDDDGRLDGLEGTPFADFDGDGAVNGLDPDADNDGLPDGLEAGIATADADTDVARGFFRADTHPASTTDPLDPDTDNGGAPDGAEDRDANGAVGAGETSPLVGADDPACATGVPPEVAVVPQDQLRLGKSGGDITLSWGALSPADPCILYRVYVSDNLDSSAGRGGFELLGVTATPTYDHRNALQDGKPHRYLVVGARLVGGEGPWGFWD